MTEAHLDSPTPRKIGRSEGRGHQHALLANPARHKQEEPAGYLSHLAHAIEGPVVVVVPGENRQTMEMLLNMKTNTIVALTI